MREEEGKIEFVKEIVRGIYGGMVGREYMVYEMYGEMKGWVGEKLEFMDGEEVGEMYGNIEGKWGEDGIGKKLGGVFMMGMGWKVREGKKEDGGGGEYDE